MTADTGIAAVEAAWGGVDEAAHAAAISFAKHVSKSTTLEADPLPKALDDLDAARGQLRAAAKLPAVKHAGPALPSAQVVPLVDGAEPVGDLQTVEPSAHGLSAYGKTASREVQLLLAPGAAPKVLRVGPASQRAAPDASWGATTGRIAFSANKRRATGEVHAGPLDAEGVVQSPTKLVIAEAVPEPLFEELAAEPGAVTEDLVVAATAVGTLDDGALAYSGIQTAIVARVKNGVFAAGPPILFDDATSAHDLDGRLVLLWSRAGVHKALLVGQGREETFELPGPTGPDACLAKQRIWAMAPGELYAFGGGQPLARLSVPEEMTLEGCTAEVAIARSGRQVAICAKECRIVRVPSAAPSHAAVAVVGGKLRAIATHAAVLGVWSEDGPAMFYALPAPITLYQVRDWSMMAMTDGKVIDLVGRVDNAYVVVRSPAL